MTRSEYQTLIDSLADNQPNTAATVRGIFEALADGATFTNELKLLDTTNAYISANFDGTGLGINEMLGYAICNGQNGTRDWRGRVPLAYDSSLYPTLGATGGTREEVLNINQIPAHTHTVPANNGVGGIGGANFPSGGGTTVSTSSSGGGLAHNNMQPYRVVLYVMKL